jgi:predicted SprT family Zn-dependent metalloprotease
LILLTFKRILACVVATSLRSYKRARREYRPPEIDPELEHQAEALLEQLVADHPFGYHPILEWRRLRTTAGLAYYGEGRIVLSSYILNTPERMALTLKHEYAHLMAVMRYGKEGKGHGKPWQECMLELGLKPEIKHDYEVQRNAPRQTVVYRCQRCSKMLVRRRRLPARKHFVHARCGGGLKLEAVRKITEAAEGP